MQTRGWIGVVVAEPLREPAGGSRARLVLRWLPKSLEHGPRRPELLAAATLLVAEQARAAPGPAVWQEALAVLGTSCATPGRPPRAYRYSRCWLST